MKVLSLLQPWASLVVMGAKQWETRSWSTAYRGPLLIHASSGKSGGQLARQPFFRNYISNFNELPFGAIIGSVELKGIETVESLQARTDVMERLTLEERAFGDYSPGRYVWLLVKPVLFERVTPARGSLRLWEFPITELRL